MSVSQGVPARERVLRAATRLFYADGITATGVDRIVAEAGVAKTSLYAHFGSKEELVRAYLADQGRRWHELLDRELAARFDSPDERAVGVFEVLGDVFSQGFGGCPFIKACSSAGPSGAVGSETAGHRAWVRQLFERLAVEAGADEPDELARELALLYHGVLVAAHLDDAADPAAPARRAAAALVAQAVPD